MFHVSCRVTEILEKEFMQQKKRMPGILFYLFFCFRNKDILFNHKFILLL